MTLFVGSQSFISPPNFMFVSAAVSEICELNQNEKKNAINTFPAHIIYPFEHMNAVRSPVNHKLKVIIKISFSTL